MITVDEVIHRNAEVVAMLKDGFGVEDIAVKTGRNLDSVRGNVMALRKCGALEAIFRGQK